MPAHVLNIAEFEHGSARSITGSKPAKAASGRLLQFPGHEKTSSRAVDPVQCARGARWALILEIGAGVFIYAVWLGWHLMHLPR